MFDDDDDCMESGEPVSCSASISPAPVDKWISPAQSNAEPANRVRRKPIPKKGHTKSRRGCQACKRRKVKCQENLPECTNCRRLGLSCVYNPGGSQVALTASPSPSTALRTAPASFSMVDLRYFHHFLVTAFPPLPMGGDAVWQAVAALSHEVCEIPSATNNALSNPATSTTTWSTPCSAWQRLTSTCTPATLQSMPWTTGSKPSSF